MKRKTGWMLLFCAAAAAAWGAPRLVCDEPVHDFGEASDDAIIEHTFVLRNEGDLTLSIERVHARCGCTVTDLSRRQIPPGGEARLPTRLSLRGRRGEVRIEMTVHSNDPRQPRYALRFEGRVREEIVVLPPLVHFGVVDPLRPNRRVAEVLFLGARTGRVTRLQSSHPFFEAEGEYVGPGVYRVQVATRPPADAPHYRERITLHLEEAGRDVLEIPVTAQVETDPEVAPSALLLSREGPPTTRYLIVRSKRKAAFEILAVETPDPSIRASLSPLGPHGYRVRLEQVPQDGRMEGRSVLLRTSHASRPVIEIPVLYLTTQPDPPQP